MDYGPYSFCWKSVPSGRVLPTSRSYSDPQQLELDKTSYYIQVYISQILHTSIYTSITDITYKYIYHRYYIVCISHILHRSISITDISFKNNIQTKIHIYMYRKRISWFENNVNLCHIHIRYTDIVHLISTSQDTWLNLLNGLWNSTSGEIIWRSC